MGIGNNGNMACCFALGLRESTSSKSCKIIESLSNASDPVEFQKIDLEMTVFLFLCALILLCLYLVRISFKRAK
jgi:hypothetical protein